MPPTKGRASLKAALEYVGKDAPYDVVMIIDADNIVNEKYLSEVNDAFANPEVKVLQTHRVAKNLNTNTAYLDAVSEEMNNSIFRLGHVNLGMPTALIGSGMAFEFGLFYDAMMTNTSVGGFDRVLEMKFISSTIYLVQRCSTKRFRRWMVSITNVVVGCRHNTIALPNL